MKHPRRRFLSVALAVALGIVPPSHVGAEDIDLFVGGNPAAVANRPNVLVIIDNSANWSAASQHWIGPAGENIKQGQSELRALKTAAGEATENLNLGMMLLTPGTGTSPIFSPSDGNKDGAYVRYHIRQMTATNKNALAELIGTNTCVNGLNSLNNTPNCIFKNYDTAGEKTGTNVDYSAAMFEAFKYLGGYTSPRHVNDGIAGTPTGPKNFGPDRYAGNPDPKSDPAAYVNGASDPLKRVHNPPIDASNNCAKNYIIFIGNGFPNKDSPRDLLTGIEGDATQLPMPLFTTTTSIVNTIIGNNGGVCQTSAECVSGIPQSLKDANPAESYSCVNPVQGLCSGSRRRWDYQASKTVIDVLATGTSALPTASKERFTDEWAKYLYTTDVNGAAGQQNVTTYTIDVFKDAQDGDSTALLSSMAKHGGGRYYQASSEEAILKALREILIEIQAVNSVFASASLPINATNRSQNENQVFIGMFRPDPDSKPRWYGNVKRYQVGLFGSGGDEARLADKDGNEAISGAFIGSCAVSFWTSDTTSFDLLTFPPTDKSYWTFSPLSAGICNLAPPGFATARSPFSDLPDGPMVEKGATAEVVRKGNNPPATDTTPTNTVNRNLFTCQAPWLCPDPAYVSNNLRPLTTPTIFPIADPNLTLFFEPWWVPGYSAPYQANHKKLVEFTRGVDVNNENANANPDGTANVTDVRPSVHGDVAHSRPLPVNYGGSNGVVVYYGANDGMFRAISGSTGKELWAFVAPEHQHKFKRLTENSPLIQYPSTPPGVTPAPQSKDYFFDGSAGLFQTFLAPPNDTIANEVMIFPTMRRGGRMLHGFDVSDPNAPVLKWRAGCWEAPYQDFYGFTTEASRCTPGFEGIGQTWSFPNVAFIKGFSTTEPVIVIGGGYDPCEDADVAAPSCGTTAKGRKVYVIQARTGALLASFNTEGSVMSDVTLIDRNFDGLVDHAYVGDTRGNLYRVDFVTPGTTTELVPASWSITKIAFTTGGNRKFQFGPAGLASSSEVFLALGSGDRERPLEINYPFRENVQNRLYMFRDKFPDPASSPPVDLDASLTDFTSGSSCTTALAIGSLGWRIDLNAGRGEQTVTSALIFGGLIFFSTNRPVSAPPGTCAPNLGEARGYALNLINASGAVGTDAICGGVRSGVFLGGGLPPSPVTGVVPIGGKPVTVMIGGIQRGGGASSPIGAQKVKPTITPRRSRPYWYTHGDK